MEGEAVRALTLHAVDLEIYCMHDLERVFRHADFSAMVLWGCDGTEKLELIINLCRKFGRKFVIFSDRMLQNLDQDEWLQVNVDRQSDTRKIPEIPDSSHFRGAMKELYESVLLPLSCPKIFRSVGLSTGARVLLQGPQTACHSLVSRLSEISESLGVKIFRVPVSSFLSKYFGDTEKKIFATFNQLDVLVGRTLLILEDVEILCSKRDEISDSLAGTINRAVAAFLTCLDGLGGSSSNFAVIGTTHVASIENQLDPALVRAGRLERWIQCDD
jgi:SpoVK/Ycf46/Vps4 family AAA+-type ATPase